MTRAFGDAIALASPSGHMSKANLKRAQKRITAELFPDGFWDDAKAVAQPTKRETLLRQASELRSLAARGMKPRAYTRKAEQLESEAAL